MPDLARCGRRVPRAAGPICMQRAAIALPRAVRLIWAHRFVLTARARKTDGRADFPKVSSADQTSLEIAGYRIDAYIGLHIERSLLILFVALWSCISTSPAL